MPVRTTPIPLRANPISALHNPAAKKMARSVQKKTLYRTRYMQCRQVQQNKGNAVYPDPSAKKCKSQYTKWQKHRGKVGARALKLADKLERKGKLDPELQALLEQDVAASAGETQVDPNLSDQELAVMASSLPVEGDASVTEEPNTMLYLAAGGLALTAIVGGIFLLRR